MSFIPILSRYGICKAGTTLALPSFLLVSFTHRDQGLSYHGFEERMSHVVRDLAGSVGVQTWCVFSTQIYASQENVRCVMGYIVDLTVILDGIFRTTSDNVSANDVQSAVDRHVDSGRRDRIHRDIRSFFTDTFAIRFTVPKRVRNSSTWRSGNSGRQFCVRKVRLVSLLFHLCLTLKLTQVGRLSIDS